VLASLVVARSFVTQPFPAKVVERASPLRGLAHHKGLDPMCAVDTEADHGGAALTLASEPSGIPRQ